MSKVLIQFSTIAVLPVNRRESDLHLGLDQAQLHGLSCTPDGIGDQE